MDFAPLIYTLFITFPIFSSCLHWFYCWLALNLVVLFFPLFLRQEFRLLNLDFSLQWCMHLLLQNICLILASAGCVSLILMYFMYILFNLLLFKMPFEISFFTCGYYRHERFSFTVFGDFLFNFLMEFKLDSILIK